MMHSRGAIGTDVETSLSSREQFIRSPFLHLEDHDCKQIQAECCCHLTSSLCGAITSFTGIGSACFRCISFSLSAVSTSFSSNVGVSIRLRYRGWSP